MSDMQIVATVTTFSFLQKMAETSAFGATTPVLTKSAEALRQAAQRAFHRRGPVVAAQIR